MRCAPACPPLPPAFVLHHRNPLPLAPAPPPLPSRSLEEELAPAHYPFWLPTAADIDAKAFFAEHLYDYKVCDVVKSFNENGVRTIIEWAQYDVDLPLSILTPAAAHKVFVCMLEPLFPGSSLDKIPADEMYFRLKHIFMDEQDPESEGSSAKVPVPAAVHPGGGGSSASAMLVPAPAPAGGGGSSGASAMLVPARAGGTSRLVPAAAARGGGGSGTRMMPARECDIAPNFRAAMSKDGIFIVPKDMLQVYRSDGAKAKEFQGRQPEEKALSLLWTEDMRALVCSVDCCTLGGSWYAKDDKSTFNTFCSNKNYGEERTKGCIVCGA